MRVISGIHRSRILEQVTSSTTRETKDRVKESIFNSISNHLYDSDVLDLFSGSGSLGIEALSRGSKYCVFNDYDKEAYNVTRKNIANLNLGSQSKVFNTDYKEVLNQVDKRFDVIFLDPPYKLDVYKDILEIIKDKALLQPDGIIIYLYGKEKDLEEHSDFIITKTKKYGITKVSYMKVNDVNENSSISR